jgi:hypothetical protein
MHSGSPMTRATKLSGVALTVFLFCAATGAFIRPQLARHFAHHVLRWRPDRIRPALGNERATRLPNVTFWAWERPEDLRYLNQPNEGVAFLAKTVYLEPSHKPSSEFQLQSVLVRPRLQPLRIATGTFLIAVVRIETSRALLPSAFFESSASEQQTPRSESDNYHPSFSFDVLASVALQRAAAEISGLQNIPNVRAIQIDFDAAVSERPFYSALLSAVRRNLLPSMPLSITALASWCIGDSWFENLPPGTIDEAIPMLFRLGPDAADVINFLHSGKDFPVASCRGSLGLSIDERLSNDLLTGRFPGSSAAWRRKRIYVFSPRVQTQSSVSAILEEWHP